MSDGPYYNGHEPYDDHILKNRATATTNLIMRMCGQDYYGEQSMSRCLKLERLQRNDLPLPKFESTSAAGFDFSACLTRQCKLVIPGGSKREFHLLKDGRRYYVDTNMPSALEMKENHPETTDGYTLHVSPYETIMVPLGFKAEFEGQYVLQIHLRSSVGLLGFLLANGTGIIDSDYRGELFACMFNRTNTQLQIKHGQRIVQGILLQFGAPPIIEGTVSSTERSSGGFGSTGV